MTLHSYPYVHYFSVFVICSEIMFISFRWQQEQLFTTNNFAPAPRNPHNVNFRDQLVTPSEPPASRHPAPRPEQAGETEEQNDPNGPNEGSDTQPTFEPERTERVDVLSPPSPMRHRVNRPHRDWDNLRMMSQPPSHYRSRYVRM